MKVVLLAAGEGQRLEPLTSTRPKPLIKVAGKPILQFCLDAVKTACLKEVIIVTHYMGDNIREYFGDGSSQGLKISYVEQKELLGTGNAVMAIEPFVDDAFVLIYGDLLFEQDAVDQVLSLFEDEKPDAVIAVVGVDKPENYGIIELADIELANGEQLRRIVEKPEVGKAPSDMANAGLYVFTKEIFEKLGQIKESARGEWELTDALNLLASEGKTVLITGLSKYEWFDMGRPWDLLDANMWALKQMNTQVLGTIEQGAHLIGPVHVAKSARIRSGAYIEGPVFIDEEADVGPNCFIRSGTSIGKKTRIGNAVEIKNSIIMDKTHIGHLSYIGDSIIGENCNFGAGTITANLRFDNNNIKMTIKNKRIDTGRRKLGIILGDNVKTGIKTSFMPGIKIAPNTWIKANLMITHDIPNNTNTQQQLKQQENTQPTKET
ncbi:MAG: NTP transferase domain-containing protein [Nitrososphaerota archaeon]|nr:NTP transferase domain-containing protein [Nitrososphaerota archaeon]